MGEKMFSDGQDSFSVAVDWITSHMHMGGQHTVAGTDKKHTDPQQTAKGTNKVDADPQQTATGKAESQ